MSAAAVLGDAVMTRRRLVAIPLAPWERDGVKAALVRTKLPADDVGDARVLVWRFETIEGTPVGFGGLEIFGSDALLRSLMTLPPLRQVGMGAAMVAMLPAPISSCDLAMRSARAARCRTLSAAAGNSRSSVRRPRWRWSNASVSSTHLCVVLGSSFSRPPCPSCRPCAT